ncbi:hypothetical protein WAJ74_21170, partial [Acinetobacter baumannii]
TSVRNSPQLEDMSKEINTFKTLKLPFHKALLENYSIETDKKKYGFKHVSKHRRSPNLYPINMFEEINSYPLQVFDRFNENFQFCSS